MRAPGDLSGDRRNFASEPRKHKGEDNEETPEREKSENWEGEGKKSELLASPTGGGPTGGGPGEGFWESGVRERWGKSHQE